MQLSRKGFDVQFILLLIWLLLVRPMEKRLRVGKKRVDDEAPKVCRHLEVFQSFSHCAFDENNLFKSFPKAFRFINI